MPDDNLGISTESPETTTIAASTVSSESEGSGDGVSVIPIAIGAVAGVLVITVTMLICTLILITRNKHKMKKSPKDDLICQGIVCLLGLGGVDTLYNYFVCLIASIEDVSGPSYAIVGQLIPRPLRDTYHTTGPAQAYEMPVIPAAYEAPTSTYTPSKFEAEVGPYELPIPSTDNRRNDFLSPGSSDLLLGNPGKGVAHSYEESPSSCNGQSHEIRIPDNEV
jgi:hypothetical protein